MNSSAWLNLCLPLNYVNQLHINFGITASAYYKLIKKRI